MKFMMKLKNDNILNFGWLLILRMMLLNFTINISSLKDLVFVEPHKNNDCVIVVCYFLLNEGVQEHMTKKNLILMNAQIVLLK